jgi:hypothetical protein
MAVIQNINVSTPNDNLGDTLRNSQEKANANFAELNAKKVEVVAGKDLSESNFTAAEKAKLAGIAAVAEVNVQSDWNQSDDTQDSYIKNKPSSPNAIPIFVYDGIIGVTVDFATGQQTFNLPVNGAVCLKVYINGALQYKTTANNASLPNRWSQTGDVVTITKTTVLNNYIYIEYQ